MIYTRKDLTGEERGELELRYREWKEKYGGLPELEERIICKAMQCAPLQLDVVTIRRLIEVEEKMNAERGVTGSTYVERWACRWLKEKV